MNIGQHPITGGMIQQLNKLDIISNNLANLNTTGFKEKNITTESFSNKISEYSKKIDLNINRNTIYAANFINQSLNMIPVPGKHYTNKKNGSIIQTGNEFDFAIIKENEFFIVEDENTHEKFLTRDGSFSPRGSKLVTKEGLVVLGNNLKPIDTRIENYENNIALYHNDYENLKSKGNNLYINDKSIEDVTQLSDNYNSILKQNLETSNINGVLEMTKMIETNRLFEQLSKVSKTLQEVDKTSNKEIGRDK